MKKIILLLLLTLVIISCTDTKKEKVLKDGKVNWSDSKAILKAVEKYYKDSTVRVNRASLSVYDKRRQLRKKKGASTELHKQQQAKMEEMLMKFPRFSSRHLLFYKADTANLHIVGKEAAWLPVTMSDRNKVDTLVVDYKVIWDEGIITFINERKIVGAFRVTEIVIQRVNNQKRYEWVEDDGYWEKQLVRDENM